MANETIYGCVNFDTGQVEFSQDPDCTYYGCMIWDGAHAGQVAIVVETDCCDDTYYGCVNWTTGQFQIILPDYCCHCECIKGLWDCGRCVAAGEDSPRFIELTVSGWSLVECVIGPWTSWGASKKVTDASSGAIIEAAVNGTHLLTQQSAVEPCRWIGAVDCEYNVKGYVTTDCSGAAYKDEDKTEFTILFFRYLVGADDVVYVSFGIDTESSVMYYERNYCDAPVNCLCEDVTFWLSKGHLTGGTFSWRCVL